MIECEWAILCDYAFRDERQKLCVIGIFDRVFTAAVPSGLRQAAFVIKLVGDAKERVQVRIEIVRPSHEPLAQLQGEVTLGDNGTGEIQLAMNGLPLPDWGIYEFNIYADDVPVKTVGFAVAKTKQSLGGK